MSDEYKAAQAKLMLEQASDVDIIITTALIPGKKAPILVNQDMLDVMKPGSVLVDLAAANGGNVAQTEADKVITTTNGVTIIGYTDLPSRLAATSSTLFGNNVAKFILSIGPQTTKEKGFFQIDMEDDAVQNMLISYNGEARWPDKITPFNPPPPPPKAADDISEMSEEELLLAADEKQKAGFIRNAGIASAASLALLAFGYNVDSPDAVSLMATFALAGLAGYQVVWGVAPALHSPLMAVTNAISGMTAVGGMLLLAGGSQSGEIIPDSPAHWMGAIATVLSFVNIVGGFLITGKMLDLFRRPEDPNDYFEFYAVPSALLLGGLGFAYIGGNVENVSGTVAIAAAICCIAASKYILVIKSHGLLNPVRFDQKELILFLPFTMTQLPDCLIRRQHALVTSLELLESALALPRHWQICLFLVLKELVSNRLPCLVELVQQWEQRSLQGLALPSCHRLLLLFTL